VKISGQTRVHSEQSGGDFKVKNKTFRLVNIINAP